ncbi:toll/interleukin-1 receptor domain-containing protein [Mucilaginibacter paludis]|uniref:TIR domain-containing protein n=1 Tax=Mucilaginibacter paludis DSM 18603 TaxID=714943 RepID=H1YH98_9SPHI|nr:TIR domain-containing protein [Mucilaginibacter paludis]EHQ24600.1 hypothetical protein Mucpa_0406 [Mucilaginibacter paludis DSM 18603]
MENTYTAGKFNLSGLRTHIATIAPKKIRKVRSTFFDPGTGFKSHHFKNYQFEGDFQGDLFHKCKFTHCKFENIWGFFLYFKNCEFIDCDFRNSRFSHNEFGWTLNSFFKCSFRNVEIDEGDIDNTIFQKCYLNNFSLIGESLFNVEFIDCEIENSQFQGIVYYHPGQALEEQARDVSFDECRISFCYFSNTDFRNSLFSDTTLYLCAFIDCVLANKTIIAQKTYLHPNYASLDFQTILKSDLLDPIILKNYFNIQAPDVKEKVKDISSEIHFKKIFISYSFKDKAFATILNGVLNKNGVKTFLWENDAPGGQYLEDIMRKNVHEHETILFIASESSLRSKACQFELSEGRRKQEETWSNVFFPIHIDHYLFEVLENQIRPIDKAKEYWENILELKRTNSKDFSAYANVDATNMEKFERAVQTDILQNIANKV